MTARIDISIGPVQSFVAQSRRTRDLWGSSYLLSFLSAHAMHGAREAGGGIVQPVVDDDPLYRWVAGKRTGEPPSIGTVPNHFVVDAEEDPRRVANAVNDSLRRAWERACDAVWKRFAEHACSGGAETERIWNRQINEFWEVTWTAGPSGSGSTLLARRKHWRSHRLPDEPGDKCIIMPDLQEISGYVRAESSRSRESQDRFWKRVGERLGRLDLRENERLCAVAFVKRLFPKVAPEALGWKVETSHWPSTVYVAAVPWIRRVECTAPQPAAAFAEAVKQAVGEDAFPMRPPSFGLGTLTAGDFARLDANYLHRHWIEDERRCPLKDSAADDVRQQLAGALASIYACKGGSGRRLGPPDSFYALLLADGDRLGKLVGQLGGACVGQALADFTGGVRETVKKHDGVTVYAGGDDVLAMLALPRALSCAAALSQSYRSAFKDSPGATLSAAVVFVHVRYPLSSALATAHRLLDDVAKDGNGRDSLAAAVLKPSGLHCEWATTWNRTHLNGDSSAAIDLLNTLVAGLKSDALKPGLSTALIYRIREMLSILCGWDRWKPGVWGTLADDLDVRAFLQAEVLHSLEVRMEAGAKARADEMIELAWKLLKRSRAPSKDGKAEHAEAGLDALLLARFLATSGHEEAD